MDKAMVITRPDVSLNISTAEIIQDSVDLGVFTGEQSQVRRICTKKDNHSKAVMDAHLKKQARHYS